MNYFVTHRKKMQYYKNYTQFDLKKIMTIYWMSHNNCGL